MQLKLEISFHLLNILFYHIRNVQAYLKVFCVCKFSVTWISFLEVLKLERHNQLKLLTSTTNFNCVSQQEYIYRSYKFLVFGLVLTILLP